MLCYLADEALICRLILSVGLCLSICLGNKDAGPCSRHICSLEEIIYMIDDLKHRVYN